MTIPVQAVIELNEALVRSWKDVPIGTDVIVTKADGSLVKTKTRSEAQMMGGHSAVIWLEGISGCYSLRKVRKA